MSRRRHSDENDGEWTLNVELVRRAGELQLANLSVCF